MGGGGEEGSGSEIFVLPSSPSSMQMSALGTGILFFVRVRHLNKEIVDVVDVDVFFSSFWFWPEMIIAKR